MLICLRSARLFSCYYFFISETVDIIEPMWHSNWPLIFWILRLSFSTVYLSSLTFKLFGGCYKRHCSNSSFMFSAFIFSVSNISKSLTRLNIYYCSSSLNPIFSCIFISTSSLGYLSLLIFFILLILTLFFICLALELYLRVLSVSS